MVGTCRAALCSKAMLLARNRQEVYWLSPGTQALQAGMASGRHTGLSPAARPHSTSVCGLNSHPTGKGRLETPTRLRTRLSAAVAISSSSRVVGLVAVPCRYQLDYRAPLAQGPFLRIQTSRSGVDSGTWSRSS